MDAEALVSDADGRVELAAVSLEDPGSRDVVVDTQYSGISNGTERNLLNGDVSWGPFPICTGYQAVGTVEAVGRDVTAFGPGDAVYYRENKIRETRDWNAVSAVRGTHCSKAVVDVDEHVAGPLPDRTLEPDASLFALAAIALNGVEMAGVRASDTVVVQGAGLVGLGVVAWASTRGAKVIATDPLANRRAVATALGAEEALSPTECDVESTIDAHTDGGADVVFEATGREDLVDAAMSMCRPGGKFVFMSDYGDADVSFHFRTPHTNQLTAYFPCGDGGEACRQTTVEHLTSSALEWEDVVTTVLDPEDAPGFYDALLDDETDDGHDRTDDGDYDLDDVLGATIAWS